MQQHNLLLFILLQFAWDISSLRAPFLDSYVLHIVCLCLARMLKAVRIALQLPPTAEYKLYPASYDSISSNISKKEAGFHWTTALKHYYRDMSLKIAH